LVVSATEKLKFVRHDGEDTIAHATMRNHNWKQPSFIYDMRKYLFSTERIFFNWEQQSSVFVIALYTHTSLVL
jgi:hypothetical protein